MIIHPRGLWAKWDIMEQISNGLTFIHDRNLIHRDIKPNNGVKIILGCSETLTVVLFSKIDGAWKIADFGITTTASGDAITSSERKGTIGYRAPELLQGKYTKKVDVWGLGCILFELVAGRRAFTSDFQVYEYSRSESSKESFLTGLDLYEDPGFLELIKSLLEIDPTCRPTAVAIHHTFALSLWDYIGSELKDNGEIDSAMRAFERGLRIDPNSTRLQKTLQGIYGEQKSLEAESNPQSSISNSSVPHWIIRKKETDLRHLNFLGQGGYGEVHQVDYP